MDEQKPGPDGVPQHHLFFWTFGVQAAKHRPRLLSGASDPGPALAHRVVKRPVNNGGVSARVYTDSSPDVFIL